MIRIVLLSLLALAFVGCSSFSSRMQDLSFGMTKEEVTDELGTDYSVAAASMNKQGQRVEAWKYQKSEKDPAYFVYFVNGKLAQWGEASALRAIPELGDPAMSSDQQ
ncbi:MAG: hypothetical protein ACQKBV_01410 [Puniceicoccales bacterium]